MLPLNARTSFALTVATSFALAVTIGSATAMNARRAPISTGIYTKHSEGCAGERDYMDDLYVEQKKISFFDATCKIRGAQPQSVFYTIDLDCISEGNRFRAKADIYQVDEIYILFELHRNSTLKWPTALYEFCPGAKVPNWPNKTDFTRSWVE